MDILLSIRVYWVKRFVLTGIYRFILDKDLSNERWGDVIKFKFILLLILYFCLEGKKEF